MNWASVHGGIIPARFLTLLAHFSILVILLWDRGENLLNCLQHYNEPTANYYQAEYVLALSLSVSFVLIELLGFLFGVSMFATLHCLYSTVSHSAAALAWSMSFIEQWECTTPFYWYIFMLCSIPPLVVELVVVVKFVCR